MKKTLAMLLAAALLLSLAACGPKTEQPETAAAAPTDVTAAPETQPTPTESEPASGAESALIRPLTLEKSLYSYYEWTDELLCALVRSEHSTVTLGGEDAQRYPEMAQVLSQIATMQENTMLEEFGNLVNFAREELSMDSDGFVPYVSTLDVQVRRADSLVISLLAETYSDYGRIRNFRVFHGTTYEPQTGRELPLNEVVVVNNDLALAVEKELQEQMWAESFHSEYAVQNYFADTPYHEFSWTLDYTGVTFYFEPNQFFDGGAMVATVSFAEYPELFSEKYMQVPDQYAVELPMDISFFADLNADGGLEAISVSGCYDNERNCYLDCGVYTNLDGYWYEDCYANEFHPYYVKSAEGHYLYLFCEDINEGARQMHLIVLRLNADGTITKTGERNLSPSWLADNRFLMPIDPAQLILDDQDSGDVQAVFAAGDSGLPGTK